MSQVITYTIRRRTPRQPHWQVMGSDGLEYALTCDKGEAQAAADLGNAGGFIGQGRKP